MRKLLLPLLLLSLTGCFGPAKFDATNDTTIKESTNLLTESLTEEQREKFQKAMMYFSIGGQEGFKSMMAGAFKGEAKPDPELTVAVNLKSLHDLTAEQILAKYDESLAEDKRRAEEREKVSSLLQEADKLLKDKKFEESIAKYKAISEIPSGVEKAEKGLLKAHHEMETFAEKMAYIDQIEVTEFTAKRIDTYSKKGVPAVRIGLKNNGDKSLDEVKVVVYFHDADGKTIFEEDYSPVLVSKYSFGRDNKPLKPGYVQEMEKDRYYTLKSTLNDWAEGQATIKVVDIEFSDSAS
ncbi:MAG: hypothetical protein HWE10_02385 [Gammaproteobacteria bacterium]|nr:hypothetical protein [Gammaproteobacteria bacterium]